MRESLKDKHILVVEGEYFIASDLSRVLAAKGAIVVGPVGDLPGGLRLAEAEPLDAALLDVNLGGVLSFPLADRLREAAVPHLFLTGYDESVLPPGYQHALHIAKPFSATQLITAIETLLDGKAA